MVTFVAGISKLFSVPVMVSELSVSSTLYIKGFFKNISQ